MMRFHDGIPWHPMAPNGSSLQHSRIAENELPAYILLRILGPWHDKSSNKINDYD